MIEECQRMSETVLIIFKWVSSKFINKKVKMTFLENLQGMVSKTVFRRVIKFFSGCYFHSCKKWDTDIQE